MVGSGCVRVRNRPGVLEGYSFQNVAPGIDCPAPRADAGRPHDRAGENAHEQNYISTSAGGFGRMRGSFTEAVRDRMARFEAADDCTLFL